MGEFWAPSYGEKIVGTRILKVTGNTPKYA
jgi:hypothetical protein